MLPPIYPANHWYAYLQIRRELEAPFAGVLLMERRALEGTPIRRQATANLVDVSRYTLLRAQAKLQNYRAAITRRLQQEKNA